MPPAGCGCWRECGCPGDARGKQQGRSPGGCGAAWGHGCTGELRLHRCGLTAGGDTRCAAEPPPTHPRAVGWDPPPAASWGGERGPCPAPRQGGRSRGSRCPPGPCVVMRRGDRSPGNRRNSRRAASRGSAPTQGVGLRPRRAGTPRAAVTGAARARACACSRVHVHACVCARAHACARAGRRRSRRPAPQLPAVLPAGRRLRPVLAAVVAALGQLAGQPGLQRLGGAAPPAQPGRRLLRLPAGRGHRRRHQGAPRAARPPALPAQVRGGVRLCIARGRGCSRGVGRWEHRSQPWRRCPCCPPPARQQRPPAATPPGPFGAREEEEGPFPHAPAGAVCGGDWFSRRRVPICRKHTVRCVREALSMSSQGCKWKKGLGIFQCDEQRAARPGTPPPSGPGSGQGRSAARVQGRGPGLLWPEPAGAVSAWERNPCEGSPAPQAAASATAQPSPLPTTAAFSSQLPLRVGHEFQQHQRPHGGLRESQ